MSDRTIVYGKDSCPHTKAALDDLTARGISYDYIDIIENPAELDGMLKLSKGERKIPVIVDGKTVTTGFNGGS